MKQTIFTIQENKQLTETTWRMKLKGDTSEIISAGQFVNIKLDGYFLRRPISVCDVEGDILTIIYKILGRGTEEMTHFHIGKELDILTGLGNGYDLSLSGDRPVLIGGGVGIPPLYLAAKRLIAEGRNVKAVLGYNTVDEIYYEEEFREIGCEVIIATADGSVGVKGFVTDALQTIAGEDCGYTYFYTCGPEPMLKAVYNATKTSGQLSFEERMGCGFGACMGCSCKTVTGYKRICKEGPVLRKEEVIW
ncbi:MAG: dihydroorotate dehydrogenase electron transfer subunit [Clostridiales bacterium]|nr:dihydroorotate dehydrogenase electron transfer subunit [Clostridiales bacterium]